MGSVKVLFLLTKIKFFIILVLSISAAVGMVLAPNFYVDQTEGGIRFLGTAPAEGSLLKKVAYIAGAVNAPGVYEINDETRISDLVQMAGGFTGKVDPDFVSASINLAKLVDDEDHVFIPELGQGNSTTSQLPGTAKVGLVSLNNASISELDSLPGVGQATAEKIIAARPFTSVDQLLNVSGIGESKYNDLKNRVTL